MLRSVDGRWGKTWFYEKDEYVGKSIKNYGEYNPDETEVLIGLAKKGGGLVLDIGANIGCMAQALEHSGFECVAFEPQPQLAKIVSMNFKGRVENCALGDLEGVADMPKVRYDDRGNFGGLSLGTLGAYGTYKVPVKTLDSFNFDGVGLIKIDVEGYEERVLRGAVETIKRCRPIMVIEDDRVDNSFSLRRFIKELGYSYTPHHPPLYREKNYFNKRRNVWGQNFVSHNLICEYVNN